MQSPPGCFMFKHMKKHQRKKPKHKKEQPIALAWYTEEQWELLRQVAADWDSMDQTFAQWKNSAGNAYRVLLESGYPVETVDVDVTDLIQWCKSRNRPIDGEARSDYIEEKVEARSSRRR